MHMYDIGGISALQNPFDMGAASGAVIVLQKALQSIARLSKDPNLAFTLGPRWADGVVGPSTAKAVNIGVRARINKAPISTTSVKRNLAKITETALGIAKGLQQVAPAPMTTATEAPAPTPRSKVREEEVKALNVVQKNDEKVLSETKITSGIIPITSDSYLKFYPGNPARKQAPGYGLFKKLAGRTPSRLGTVLVLVGVRKLKMTIKAASINTAQEIRRRIPAPWNTYSISLNGRMIAKQSIKPAADPPPPVSPFVPPEAPPDATASDYSTPATPPVVKKDVEEKQPPPPKDAPPTLPPSTDPATPRVTITSIPPTLRRGARGVHVVTLQNTLKKLGLMKASAPTGFFGSGTYRLVRGFQASKRLKIDGVVGPNTWRALGFGKTTITEPPPTLVTPVPPGPPMVTLTAPPTLRRGAKGNYVRVLQTKLRSFGLLKAVDGDFGRLTDKAVRAFQVSNGLKPDGIVGPKTWLALGIGKKTVTPPQPIPPQPVSDLLPLVPETEDYLERFFMQDILAGETVHDIRNRQFDVEGKMVHDIRHGQVPANSWFAHPPSQNTLVEGIDIQGKNIEIMEGHDEMDDVDEEMADLEASGFEKGWW